MGRLAEATTLTRQDAIQAIQDVPVLDQLSGKNLFLTGGTGFVGSWLLEAITAFNDRRETKHPCHVSILTRDPSRFAQRAPHLANRPDLVLIPGDVRTFQITDLPDVQFDAIIHAAAPADPASLANNPAHVVDTIVNGTRRVLEWSVGQEAAHFLFVSSGAVYRAPREDASNTPRAAYARAKQTAEALCMSSGLSVTIARPFTFIGPYLSLDAGFAITDFIRAGLYNKTITVRNGSAIRSYAYGADLARWLLAILLAGKPLQAYDIGSDEALSVLELAERIQTFLRRQGIEAYIQVENPTQSGYQCYIPDTRRMREDLGLYPRVSLDEALARTITWFKDKQ